jgi:hypothetical protein
VVHLVLLEHLVHQVVLVQVVHLVLLEQAELDSVQ